MAENNMHQIATLIKRLEAATSRLEDIASSTIELPRAVPGLETASADPTEKTQEKTQEKTGEKTLANAPIEAFDEFIAGPVRDFSKYSDEIGGKVAKQAAIFCTGFTATRQFLLISTKAKKPNESELKSLMKPVIDAGEATIAFKNANPDKKADLYDHLDVLSEATWVLNWISVETNPHEYILVVAENPETAANNVLRKYRQDPVHKEWVQAVRGLIGDLAKYCKNHYANGITWNDKGAPAAEVAKALSSPPALSAPKAAGSPAPPPPPPPGPAPVLQIKEESAPANPTGGGRSAVFSELNKGEAVTKGLRKVDKSEMTHKNPALRAGSTVPDVVGSARGKSPVPQKKPKPKNMQVKKPPKMELDVNKWIIENFEQEPNPVEIEASLSHSVLISKCNGTMIVIKGKANAVTIENSNGLKLQVDSLISSVDAVNAQNLQLQVDGVVPTVMLDKIDGAQIWLSRESMSTSIYSSMSSNINVSVKTDDGDSREIPLPSQILHRFDPETGKIVNEIVEHAG